VPDTALKQIAAAAANNLFHGCHRSLMIEGLELKNGKIKKNYMEIFILLRNKRKGIKCPLGIKSMI
jgi:hypothetical protein